MPPRPRPQPRGCFSFRVFPILEESLAHGSVVITLRATLGFMVAIFLSHRDAGGLRAPPLPVTRFWSHGVQGGRSPRRTLLAPCPGAPRCGPRPVQAIHPDWVSSS